MRSGEAFAFVDIAATTAPFYVTVGGIYGADYAATFGGGSITLEKRAADGVTYVPVATAVTANGAQIVYLPPGWYEFVIVTATAVYIQLTRIPME